VVGVHADHGVVRLTLAAALPLHGVTGGRDKKYLGTTTGIEEVNVRGVVSKAPKVVE